MKVLNDSEQMFETYGLDFEKFINDGPDNWGFALKELQKNVQSDYDIKKLQGLKLMYATHIKNKPILLNNIDLGSISTNVRNVGFYNSGPSDTIR